MSARPEFAVAIPAHDALPDVLDAVESALAQSHPPAEVVVVDDRSSDGTGEAVRQRFGDRVSVVRGNFGGAAAARNAAWRASRSPWVAFLDADDLWFPDKLATAADRLTRAPGAVWFFSDGAFRTIDGDTRNSWFDLYAEIEEPYLGVPLAELFEVNFVLTSSVVARRDALEALGGFREDMSHAEDLDLWIRLARRGPAAGTGRSLVRYQHRPGGLTRAVESRLQGNAGLFRRLAEDRALPSGLRRLARRRSALASYKLALSALREGRTREARLHAAGSWLFPERLLPFALVWSASRLPASWVTRARSARWATRTMVSPMGRHRRVILRNAAVEGNRA